MFLVAHTISIGFIIDHVLLLFNKGRVSCASVAETRIMYLVALALEAFFSTNSVQSMYCIAACV